jgi:hypothetical protein
VHAVHVAAGVVGLALFATSACHRYDPVDGLDFRELPDTRSAVATILGEVADDGPRVFAVGEYHETIGTSPHRPALSRFAVDVLDQLVPYAHDLVVESWLDLGCEDAAAASVPTQLEQATGRQVADATALATALARGEVAAHGLSITCIEQSALVDRGGQLDFLLLLEVVTGKLLDATRAVLARGGGVIVYGGALHNDLYPEWPLDELSYAEPLARELGGHVVEIDLIAPEAVAAMRSVRGERWFPLLARSTPDHAILWQRGPDSYVVILPAETTAVAAVAVARE